MGVLFALVAAAYADAEAEADPYLLYGGYNGYAGWGGYTGYAGLPYGAYGYAGHLGYSAFPVGHSVVSKAVEVTPAKVEVKAITAPAVVGHQVVAAAPVVAASPAAYTYHHAAPVAAAPAVAAAHVIAKRDAEADADPAYFYNGYAGYGGYFGGYAGLYAGAYAGYPYAGAYAGYPYAGAYAAAPSDPTAPHLVHTSRFGICTNYLGARVSC